MFVLLASNATNVASETRCDTVLSSFLHTLSTFLKYIYLMMYKNIITQRNPGFSFFLLVKTLAIFINVAVECLTLAETNVCFYITT